MRPVLLRVVFAEEQEDEAVSNMAEYADIDSRDRDLRTALHHAALSSDAIAIRKLIHVHADATIRDSSNRTALHLALTSDSAALDGTSLRQLAAHTVKQQVERGSKLTDLSLLPEIVSGLSGIAAADARLLRSCEFMLTLPGVDVNARDRRGYGRTSLMLAARHGMAHYQNLMVPLIEAGADLQAKDSISGASVLRYAMRAAATHGLALFHTLVTVHGATITAEDLEPLAELTHLQQATTSTSSAVHAADVWRFIPGGRQLESVPIAWNRVAAAKMRGAGMDSHASAASGAGGAGHANRHDRAGGATDSNSSAVGARTGLHLHEISRSHGSGFGGGEDDLRERFGAAGSCFFATDGSCLISAENSCSRLIRPEVAAAVGMPAGAPSLAPSPASPLSRPEIGLQQQQQQVEAGAANDNGDDDDDVALQAALQASLVMVSDGNAPAGGASEFEAGEVRIWHPQTDVQQPSQALSDRISRRQRMYRRIPIDDQPVTRVDDILTFARRSAAWQRRRHMVMAHHIGGPTSPSSPSSG